jgi:hypothetical protein
MEAAVGEALIKGCQTLSNQVDGYTGWQQRVWDTILPGNDYNGPSIVDDNLKTFYNYSSYPITIIYPDGQFVLFPNNSKAFYNEDPDRRWDDFQFSFSYRYDENLVSIERGGDEWSVTFYDKITDDILIEKEEYAIHYDSDYYMDDNLSTVDNELTYMVHDEDQRYPETGNVLPDFIEPTENQGTIPREPQYPLPMISNFQIGKYYLQIGSYANINNVYNEIASINQSLPIAVMRTNVIINGIERNVYRVLIGPLNYSESRTLLQQFRVKYRDAFVWTGR